jgi:hypothetical protein
LGWILLKLLALACSTKQAATQTAIAKHPCKRLFSIAAWGAHPQNINSRHETDVICVILMPTFKKTSLNYKYTQSCYTRE